MARRKSEVEQDEAEPNQVEKDPVEQDEAEPDQDIDDLREALLPGQRLVQFTRDVVVEDEHQGTDRETRFAGGQIAALPEDSARHFVNRGKAVELIEV